MNNTFTAQQIKKFENIVSSLIKPKRTQTEKMIYYLRIYTDLVVLESAYKAKDALKTEHTAKKVHRFTETCDFADEKVYAKKINSLIKSFQENNAKHKLTQKTHGKIHEHKNSSLIRSAQSMCVLRLTQLQ